MVFIFCVVLDGFVGEVEEEDVYEGCEVFLGVIFFFEYVSGIFFREVEGIS